MDKNLEDFVQNLKEQIYAETQEAYGEIAYGRWLNPRFKGPIKEPDGHAVLRGPCGDSMEIFLRFEDGRVKEASFQTDGCGSSTVCGSFAAEMALGKETNELLKITGEALMEKLGGLPDEDAQCAFLAAETLQGALKDYMVRQSKEVRGGGEDAESGPSL